VYDETFAEVLTLALGECAPVETITYGIVNVSELFISSPQFRFSLYGLIGGGVGPAQKVGSIYTGATAVDIPAGLCAAFGNRIVLATGNVLLFSDPQAPRTFVALNQIGVAGTITSLVTGTDGLYVATTQGVYVMPIDALAQGQDVSAVFSTSTAYQSFSWDNIAVSQSSIAALDSTAIVPLGAGLKGTPVQDPEINRRYLTPNLVLQDLRYYRLFGGVEGWVMATPQGRRRLGSMRWHYST
jgi:hypothetical protein